MRPSDQVRADPAEAWSGLAEAMFEDAIGSSVLLDRAYRVVRVNEAFASRMGLDPAHCRGRRFAELLGDGGLQRRLEEAAASGRRTTVSIRAFGGATAHRSAPSDWRWRITPVRGPAGLVELLFLSGLDVTELENAEHPGDISRSIYETAFNRTTEGIVFQGHDGQILAANPAAERLLGLTLDEVLSRDSHTPDWRAEREDGTPFPGEWHPAMVTLRTGKPQSDVVMGVRRPMGERVWLSINSQPVFGAGQASPWGVVTTFHDITERRAAEQRQALMIHELNHRVKNALTLVQAIAAETLKTTPEPAAFTAAFNARLLALAKSHDVLTRTDWTGAQLRELILGQLAPFARSGEERFHLRGPDVLLPPKVAIALGVALSELATNAVKYGAFSVEGGTVDIEWGCEKEPSGRRLRILWRERGGPVVRAPARRGLGGRLIERGLPYELGGAARLAFDPEGVSCEISFPLVEEAR